MTDEYDDNLPDALINELKRTDKAPAIISSRVDRELARQAEQQFATRRRRQPKPYWYAAAASVMLAVFAIQNYDEPVQTVPVESIAAEAPRRDSFSRSSYQDSSFAAIPADMDVSGDVTILDAMLLAQVAGRDDETVRAIAAQAVQLEES